MKKPPQPYKSSQNTITVSIMQCKTWFPNSTLPFPNTLLYANPVSFILQHNYICYWAVTKKSTHKTFEIAFKKKPKEFWNCEEIFSGSSKMNDEIGATVVTRNTTRNYKILNIIEKKKYSICICSLQSIFKLYLKIT